MLYKINTLTKRGVQFWNVNKGAFVHYNTLSGILEGGIGDNMTIYNLGICISACSNPVINIEQCFFSNEKRI